MGDTGPSKPSKNREKILAPLDLTQKPTQVLSDLATLARYLNDTLNPDELAELIRLLKI